jgi:2-polyprenyl-3-methyl-5-hydroxy-6-metoxy-1,4-benzoquinol methylase
VERTTVYTGLTDRLFGAPGTWTLHTCVQCGLIYLDPRPTKDAMHLVYTAAYGRRKAPPGPARRGPLSRIKAGARRGYLANAYGYGTGVGVLDRTLGLGVLLIANWRERLDHSVLQLRAQPGGRLLDIGCGVGALVETLGHLGWNAEGIDTDEEVVAVCRARGLRVSLGTLEEQRYPDNHFDVVTMMHVIEHVPDPVGTLREVHRILKPGGRVLMLTPNTKSLGRQRFGMLWLGLLEVPRHLCLFNGAILSLAAQRAGFARAVWHTSARISFFCSLNAFELRHHQRSAYGPVSRESRLHAAGFEREVRRRLRRDPEVGDELHLVAHK